MSLDDGYITCECLPKGKLVNFIQALTWLFLNKSLALFQMPSVAYRIASKWNSRPTKRLKVKSTIIKTTPQITHMHSIADFATKICVSDFVLMEKRASISLNPEGRLMSPPHSSPWLMIFFWISVFMLMVSSGDLEPCLSKTANSPVLYTTQYLWCQLRQKNPLPKLKYSIWV